ncbi:MAG: hypothetical protein KatS3mg104_2539 [Phycisphaerae bacterium]|nr:MAG: hypothetical protein KatS3mg104_2539 [Phycisphaerae bacterium]
MLGLSAKVLLDQHPDFSHPPFFRTGTTVSAIEIALNYFEKRL